MILPIAFALVFIALFFGLAIVAVYKIRVVYTEIITLINLERLGFNRENEIKEQYEELYFQIFALTIYVLIIYCITVLNLI